MRWSLASRRRLPRSSLVFALLAGVCTVGAFLVVRGEAATAGQGPDGTAGQQQTVIVAARDLSPADVLDADDVAEASVPLASGPPGALTSVELAVGASPTSAIAAGEVLTATRVGAGGPVARIVPDGYVGYQVEVAAVPSGLRAGDRVDVLATAAGGRTYTSVVAEDVRVLSLPAQAQGSSFSSGGAAPWALLLVTPADASALATAGSYARLSLAIRASGSFPDAPPASG